MKCDVCNQEVSSLATHIFACEGVKAAVEESKKPKPMPELVVAPAGPATVETDPSKLSQSGYYCKKCDARHAGNTKIARLHTAYAGTKEEPTNPYTISTPEMSHEEKELPNGNNQSERDSIRDASSHGTDSETRIDNSSSGVGHSELSGTPESVKSYEHKAPQQMTSAEHREMKQDHPEYYKPWGMPDTQEDRYVRGEELEAAVKLIGVLAKWLDDNRYSSFNPIGMKSRQFIYQEKHRSQRFGSRYLLTKRQLKWLKGIESTIFKAQVEEDKKAIG